MARKAGRTKPMSPKAGVTKTRRRYGCGGKIKKRRVEVLKDCGAIQTQGLLNSFGGIY